MRAEHEMCLVEGNTYMLRSAAGGIQRVSQRLNGARAMMLCCSANSVSKPRLMASAGQRGSLGAPSRVVGTPKPPTKPSA